MTPGQRITFITECARLLAMQEWPEIDIILKACGCPIDKDDARGGKLQYAIAMLEASSDGPLQALHSYLMSGDADAPADGPWVQGKLKLFFGHLAIHQGFVGQVGDALSADGVCAFVAHTSIEPSKEWEVVIESALRTCDAMAVFLHKGFHASNWCDQEVGFGLARRVPTLPIIIDEKPYGFMSKYQAIRGTGLTAGHIASKITDWLVATPKAQAAMTDGLVTMMERLNDYDDDDSQLYRISTLMGRVPYLTPEQKERITEAGFAYRRRKRGEAEIAEVHVK